MPKDVLDGYTSYLNNVAPARRDEMARAIEDVPVDDYEGVLAVAKKGLAAVFAGDLSPEMSQEARAWAELMLVTMDRREQRDNPQVAPRTNVFVLMEEARQQALTHPIEATYTTVKKPEPLPIAAKKSG